MNPICLIVVSCLLIIANAVPVPTPSEDPLFEENIEETLPVVEGRGDVVEIVIEEVEAVTHYEFVTEIIEVEATKEPEESISDSLEEDNSEEVESDLPVSTTWIAHESEHSESEDTTEVIIEVDTDDITTTDITSIEEDTVAEEVEGIDVEEVEEEIVEAIQDEIEEAVVEAVEEAIEGIVGGAVEEALGEAIGEGLADGVVETEVEEVVEEMVEEVFEENIQDITNMPTEIIETEAEQEKPDEAESHGANNGGHVKV